MDRAPARHEPSDVEPRSLMYFLAGLFVLCALAMVLMAWMFRVLYEAQPAPQLRFPAEKQTVNLRVDPTQDIRTLRQTEDFTLSSYGWVDQKTGVVRIPIARAMELVAERGLPARQEKKQ